MGRDHRNSEEDWYEKESIEFCVVRERGGGIWMC